MKLIIAILLLFASQANAAYPLVTLYNLPYQKARFSWCPVNDASVIGYKVHWGTTSGTYDHVFDAGNVDEAVIEQFYEGVEYYTVITAYDAYMNESDFSEEIGFVYSPYKLSNPIDRTKWKVFYASSQMIPTHEASSFLDGDKKTFWMSSQAEILPQNIVIDMGEEHNIVRFRIMPRQDGGGQGNPCKLEFYVSNSTDNWGDPVGTRKLKINTLEKHEDTHPKTGRFFKINFISAQAGANLVAVAELNADESVDTSTLVLQKSEDLKTWEDVRRSYVEKKDKQFFRINLTP